jgi:hypothetical protein
MGMTGKKIVQEYFNWKTNAADLLAQYWRTQEVSHVGESSQKK